jgi:plastocyanin
MLWVCVVVGLVAADATAETYQVDPTINGVTVQGRIKLSGLPKENAPIPVYRDNEYCGDTSLGEISAVDSSANGSGNVVVSLVGVERGKPLIPSESPLILEIESKKCRFSPHLSTAAVGTVLEVRNLDPILHNLHVRRDTRFGPTVMNVIQPAGTRSVQKPFSEAGFLDVRCDVHAFMSAFVHVFDHPYYTTADPTGNFAIKEVPPGVYKLRIWHEQLGTRERTIKVPPGENVTVEIELGGKNLSPSDMSEMKPAR